VSLTVFDIVRTMGSELDPDAALMLRVRQGDLAAFSDLVDRYKQPVINFVARMLRDEIEAEDIAQKTFVQVHRAADRYPAESLDAEHPAGDDHPARQFEDRRATPPDQALLQGELQDQVQQALNTLPEDQRAALVLCLRDDLSYEDIGQILGRSLSSVKSLIFRARENMKSKIKPCL
jgi:RNA polymerase sigma-70 factor (ECF subfamily)